MQNFGIWTLLEIPRKNYSPSITYYDDHYYNLYSGPKIIVFKIQKDL